MQFKYKKLNSSKFALGGSTNGPPGTARIYHYAKNRKDSCLYSNYPPHNSLGSGEDLGLSSPPITSCHSYDYRRSSSNSWPSGEVIYRDPNSRKFTTVVCTTGSNLRSLPLQSNQETNFNHFNYGEVIITRRKYHRNEGGVA